jgi:hypothetical protein
MASNTWDHWVLLRPLFVFLLACLFLGFALIIRCYREWRDAQRAQRAKSVDVASAVDEAMNRAEEVTGSYEVVRRHAEASPREWDGGQARPNWNLRSG